ncbi:hypothetical protein A1QC_05470 [Vibrio rumoiensis 1S-45]|uniref:HTH luxR-type domain-containing protein n=2 Tax=Vibrio rumoiensis TaxID=76258 RepID=A0A1E5E574_9VIBR|nr:hypothetical protein A1QC_05470 [Vibrio rumoiensis 1S-45]
MVYFLSPLLSEQDPLISHLQSHLGISVKPLNIATIAFIRQSPHPYLVLVDAQFSENELFELQTHPLLKQSRATALFNAPAIPNLMLLSQWYHLAGYFYQDDTMDKVLLDTKAMISGKNRLPRALLIELFEHWQTISRQSHNTVMKAKLSLTRRELEILEHLQIGHSNLDIADNLFVSEHTIKSHLYRIFRKISVNNRRQAINWAQLYL